MADTNEFELVFEGISNRWKNAASQAEFAIICSPYISSPLASEIIYRLDGTTAEIYTSCRVENFINRSSSIASLVDLAKKGHRIYSIENLHAKITIFSNTFATLGSQNTTMRGMNNQEGNMVITHPDKVAELKAQINKWAVDAVLMTYEDLEEIQRLVKPFTKRYLTALRQAKAAYKYRNVKENRPSRASNNQSCADKREESKSKIIKGTSIRDKLHSLKQTNTLLKLDSITLGVATQFVRSCAWWYAHPKAQRSVRAPGHADNIKDTARYGWTLAFGSNYFLVSRAIIQTRNEINLFIDSYDTTLEYSLDELRKRLERIVSGCVANYAYEEYGTYYPLERKHMVLSVHSINVEDAADFMVQRCGLVQIFEDAGPFH